MKEPIFENTSSLHDIATLNEQDKCSEFQSDSKIIADKINTYKVLITDEYATPIPVVEQGEKTIVSEGNIATILGKPKAFKTFLISAIAAGFLEDITLSISGKGGIVLIIDTEQSKAHVNKVQSRIYRLCGWDLTKPDSRLVMLSLRELDAKGRMEVAIQAIETIKPDLVIIDGVRDLLADFNDVKESSAVVGELMRLSSQFKCGIINVLHQNKADNNARGHLGTELCNKSETVLQVVNESGTATVSPVYSRNIEIEPFSFRINGEGLPEACNAPKIEVKTAELTELMKKAMFGTSWWTKKDLIAKVMSTAKRSDKTARRSIKEAESEGIIKLNNTGHYILPTIEHDDTLPF